MVSIEKEKITSPVSLSMMRSHIEATAIGWPSLRLQRGRLEHAPLSLDSLVARGVGLAHARIDRDPQALFRSRSASVFGDRHEAVELQHRQAGAEGQALRHRARRAHTGEGARAAPETDGAKARERQPSLAQQREDGWQKGLRGPGTARQFAPPFPQAVAQPDVHRFGGGVQHEQALVHGRARKGAHGPGPQRSSGPMAGRGRKLMASSVAAHRGAPATMAA